MRQSILETIVGAFVLLFAFFLLLFAYKATYKGREEDRYTLIAKFERADGLLKGADVRIGGVTVGEIEDLILDPDLYIVNVQLKIAKNISLPRDTIAQIMSESLLGGKYLSLLPGGEEEEIQPGGQITHTQSAVNLENLIGKAIYSKEEKGDEASPSP